MPRQRVVSVEAAVDTRQAGAECAVLSAVAAVAILLLLTPVLVLVALAVKLDGCSVFFHQTRVGRDGRAFQMIKFRSMVVAAEARLSGLLEHDEGADPLFKLKHDPSITRVGAFFRKYSLDELPRLFNVVAGTMGARRPAACSAT